MQQPIKILIKIDVTTLRKYGYKSDWLKKVPSLSCRVVCFLCAAEGFLGTAPVDTVPDRRCIYFNISLNLWQAFTNTRVTYLLYGHVLAQGQCIQSVKSAKPGIMHKCITSPAKSNQSVLWYCGSCNIFRQTCIRARRCNLKRTGKIESHRSSAARQNVAVTRPDFD